MFQLKKTLCALALVATATMMAQQDPNRSFYRQSMNLINPAFAGANTFEEGKQVQGQSELGIDFRSQWSGVDGAPEMQSAFFATGLGKNVGLGVSVLNDQTFIENQTAVAIDFSYKLKINDENFIFLGLKAGGSSYNANLAGLTTFGFGADSSLDNISGRFNPTVGAGVLLKGKSYFVSVSTPNFITSERLEEEMGTARLGQSRAHYYAAAGVDIAFGSNLTFKPSAILRYIEATPTSFELTGLLSFNERFQLGPTYRFDESFGGLFLLSAADWIDIGYAYEASLNNPIVTNSNGTHEIFLKFKM